MRVLPLDSKMPKVNAARMLRDFEATRNHKHRKGSCGSHKAQKKESQNKKEGKADILWGKIVRKKLPFMSLEAKKEEANSNWLSL